MIVCAVQFVSNKFNKQSSVGQQQKPREEELSKAAVAHWTDFPARGHDFFLACLVLACLAHPERAGYWTTGHDAYGELSVTLWTCCTPVKRNYTKLYFLT